MSHACSAFAVVGPGPAARGPARPRAAGLRAAAVALALLSGAAAAPARAQPEGAPAAVVVQAPHYGDTLFRFYQEQYFDALSGLLVSRHFGRVAPHDDEAEVLRGGMLLAWGMHPQAAAVFERLIDSHAAPAVRDRAWFQLARIRHQRGLLAEAEQALDRVGEGLPPAQHDERRLLQAQLLIARRDHAAAARVLQDLQDSPTAGRVARFNLGVALLRDGQAERAEAVLDEVGRAPAQDEEQRSVRDRANLALGFAALQSGRPGAARVALQRVRLHGAASGKALLGFGWAAAELGQPQLALQPWGELAARAPTDAAALEARIALPYALAETGATRRALAGYHDAAALFERERTALAATIEAIRGGALVRALDAFNAGADGLGTLAQIDTLPELPHAAHLAPLVATHGFQEAYKHLRDLRFLGGRLALWQDNLGSFAQMLDNQQRAFAERLPRVRQRSGAIDLAALQQRRDTLAAELQRALDDDDAAAFADEAERALQARIVRARRVLERAGDDVAGPEAAERLRRVAGALTWQLTRDLPQRSWQARKALRETDAALEQVRQRDAALLQAQRDEPARRDRFAARIAELDHRVRALQPRVEALAAEAGLALQDIAVAELQGQQERLAVYLAQAQLAIAQILDRAPLARRDAPAEPRP